MEGECYNHIRRVYRVLGISENGYNVFSVSAILALLGNTLYIVYKVFYPKNENPLTILHFVSLGFFYCGTSWVMISRRPTFLHLARECDTFVGLVSEEYKNQYKKIRERLRSSKMHFGANYMVGQIMGIATFIPCRPLVRHFLRGGPREFVISGQEESDIKFWLLNTCQTCFMAAAGVWMAANTQLYMRIILHITCKIQLLNHVLSNIKYNPNIPMDQQIAGWNKTAKECATHYTHILRVFKEFQSLCTYSFVFIYFGLFGSMTISRAAITGEHPDWSVFPEFFAETSYIFYYCLCLQDVINESDNIIFSIYESDWLYFPRSTIKMLLIIGGKSKVPPLVPLFRGGSPAQLQTYGVLLNASMAYFMSALIL